MAYGIHGIDNYCCFSVFFRQVRDACNFVFFFQDLHKVCLGTVPVLILPSSWKREGGKSLHSWLPIKSTMLSSPPLAMIWVMRRRAVISLLLPGAEVFPLHFLDLVFCVLTDKVMNGRCGVV